MKIMMNWHYKVLGGHTHVRVFMNGGKCGDLVFRNEEFDQVVDALTDVTFINEEESDYWDSLETMRRP